LQLMSVDVAKIPVVGALSQTLITSRQ
jgi:hypothetical protein